MEGAQIVWCPSIPHAANRTPAYRHNIASQSWLPTVWTIWDYFRSPPGLCSGSSSLLYCNRLDYIQLCRYHGHHSWLLEIHGPRLCWWYRVLFSDCPSKWPYTLSSFDKAAHTMGLNTSWSKTNIQNLGHEVTPAPVHLQGHIVKSTDRFTYLWQLYPLVWGFHPRDTQAHRSSFKYIRQTGQRLEADRIEFTDEDTALQCPCHHKRLSH